MESKIQNTLFSFATLRVPETISDGNKNNFFIHHPAPEESDFNAENLEAFKTSITAFTPKSLSELKADHQDLFDFGREIIKRRNSITKNTYLPLAEELDPLPDLGEGSIVSLWDQYIYHVTKNDAGSSEILEAIQAIILADYLLRNVTLEETLTNEEEILAEQKRLKRNLFARIVLPNFLLFQKEEETSTSNSTQPKIKIDEQNALRTAQESYSAEEEILMIQLLQKQLKKVKTSYQKAEKIHKKEYDDEYNALYKQYLIDTAQYNNLIVSDDDEPIDTPPISEGTVSGGDTDIEPPIYNYQALVEIDTEVILPMLTGDAKDYFEDMDLTGIDSFVELDEELNEKLKDLTDVTFATKQSAVKMVNVAGNNLKLKFQDDIYTEGNPGTPGTGVDGTNNGSSAIGMLSFGITPKRKNNISNQWKFDLILRIPEGPPISSIVYKIKLEDDVLFDSEEITKTTVQGYDTVALTLFSNYITLTNQGSLYHIEAVIVAKNQKIYTIKKDFYLIANRIDIGIIDIGNTTENETEGNGNGNNNGGGNNSNSNVISPFNTNINTYGIYRLGIAEYKKVVQTFCCYKPGEVAHIENIMAKEYKEKYTKRMSRKEDTTTLSTSSEYEKQTDTSSTQRFEMNKEVSSVLQQSKDFSLNAGISGEAFKVKFNASSALSMHNSKEESNRLAINESKEITEKVVEKVIQKVSEERVIKMIEEFTEENKHGFDNRGENAQNVSGVYRWVDKEFKNEIYNYGKRLMYEFMIPEPSKLCSLLMEKDGSNKFVILEKPTDPRENGLKSYQLLDESNCNQWASLYNVEVEPKPADTLVIGKSYAESKRETGGFSSQWNDIAVPEGYDLKLIKGVADFRRTGKGNSSLTVQIANYRVLSISTDKELNYDHGKTPLNPIIKHDVIERYSQDTVPVSVTYYDLANFSLNVTLTFNLSEVAKKKWQIQTFNKIIEAYESRLATYIEQSKELEADSKEKMKINPYYHRDIENKILRHNCISYLVSNLGKSDYNFFNSEIINEFSVRRDAAFNEAVSKAKFLEQAFEWENISYVFYPYYWAKADSWKGLFQADSDDALFKQFLQSGLARVIVTVRLGFEDAVTWYMQTGQVWNGANPPIIGESLYLSVIDELMDQEYKIDETWISRIPSSLTVLQSGTIALDAKGLPCDCGEVYDEQGEPVSSNDNLIHTQRTLANLPQNSSNS